MDTYELFQACKRGDLAKVQHLVEQKEMELNVRDRWDSTPLYYACLCGHEDLVKYMLENGAKCEAHTFDGERCLYGALTDEIRNLLKKYKVISSKTIRRHEYDEFLRKLSDRGFYADIIFYVHGVSLPAHRCILTARSKYFAELFKTRWKDRKEIHITHALVYPWAFKAVLQYLYTAQIECHIDQVEDILRVAKQCRLEQLMEEMEDKLKKVVSFESTKPGVNVTQIVIEPLLNSNTLSMELGVLADHALPQEMCIADGELPFPSERLLTYPDLCLSIQGHHYMVHKAFFCGRSDYFKALLQDHFCESETLTDSQSDPQSDPLCDPQLPVISLHDVDEEVFVQVMYYIYQDTCELNDGNVFDILWTADMYLLPGLKRQCSNVIGNCLSCDNVISVLRTARLFNLPRLEDQCTEHIANNIDKMVKSEDFISLVAEDAQGVKERHETDTIPVIDDVRFHITNFVQTFSEVEDANAKLILIDGLLEELNLEG
ncbi:ankyrin repeat and BTB/POZ domain-containing protein 1 [Lingula anatina]|uniref:Ankyrin repeat and BTB/POZ domain-containing protein 1 n=1 Tax=Lingula anatina TaxID=7574 RepID=A0A1S3IRX7_LINAN|nr:ankyrin repeat and BTB/POZ domain-containing protein 1 [Lingula anatina]|eukprot:XP_013400284.1 ankyrin repeat and BTB/POZ domain-containing protein 1 [Lingula anatina]